MGISNHGLKKFICRLLLTGLIIGENPVNVYAYDMNLISEDTAVYCDDEIFTDDDEQIIESEVDISERLNDILYEPMLEPETNDDDILSDENMYKTEEYNQEVETTEDNSSIDNSFDELVDEDVAFCENVYNNQLIPAESEDGVSKIDMTIADGNVLVGVSGSYYTETDIKILNRINEIRLEACKEGLIDPATKKTLSLNDYQPVRWSADMEAIARQRAAEASIKIAHQRPNNNGCFSVKTTTGVGSNAESLAWNYDGIMRGIEQWYEEKSDYVNKTGKTTGHYAHLISTAYTYTAIGCYRNYTGGWYCVAQESYKPNVVSVNRIKNTAFGATTAYVEFDKECVKQISIKNKPDFLYLGDTACIGLTAKTETSNGTYGIKKIEGDVKEGGKYTSSDESILTVSSNGILSANRINEGDADITATAGNCRTSIIISVIDPNRSLTYTITYDMQNHGTAPSGDDYTKAVAGGRLKKPEDPDAEGYDFAGWYKDTDCTRLWDFETDTVNEDLILYAGWIKSVSGNFAISDVSDRYYTGSAVKPSVIVKDKMSGAILKAGKDYTVKYVNNTDVYTGTEDEKKPAVIVTGKGNYSDSKPVYFNIIPVAISDEDGNVADGFTLKYNETLTISNKSQKVFSSIKYKKAMINGKDYSVKLTAFSTKDAGGGNVLKGMVFEDLKIPAGYSGTFELTIKGSYADNKGNYSGTITKYVYVTEKTKRLDTAKITLGKNQKSIDFNKDSRTLNPGIYNASEKKYYIVSSDGISSLAEKNGDNLFTVKCGNVYLEAGKDYEISYRDNDAVGTAFMVLRGKGEYKGTKEVKFKIVGGAFNTKTVKLSNIPAVLEYTGLAQTVNSAVLVYSPDAKTKKALLPGRDYTITYKNNVNAGKMTVTFTGLVTGGFKGSIKKTIKINQLNISDDVKIWLDRSLIKSEVEFCKGGARPDIENVFVLSSNGAYLTEGKDYTIKTKNNKAVASSGSSSAPEIEVKGKGNFTGSYRIKFSIISKAISSNEISVKIGDLNYSDKKSATYVYKPSVKLMDNKSSVGSSDYKVKYVNCNQTAVKNYLDKIVSGNSVESIPWSETPHIEIMAVASKGYSGVMGVYGNERDREACFVPIVPCKLSSSNTYIVVEEASYTGTQVKPKIRVYYTDDKSILKEIRKYRTHSEIMAVSDSKIKYLTGIVNSGTVVYSVTYGENTAAGKNKGVLTINGASPYYGGKISVKFNINSASIR